ncbi:MAG: glutamate--tRNA ligase, partial [Acidimicrobiales bacterium]
MESVAPEATRRKRTWETTGGHQRLDGVGRSGAIFDLKKLDWINGEYLAEMEAETLVALVRPSLE